MRVHVWPFVLVAALVAGVAVLGIGARATYGAQTTADEPQYLLSAISLFEDGDLDISDELAGHRAAPFHGVELPQQTEERPDGSRISPHGPLLPLLLALPMGLWGWIGAKAALALLGGILAGVTAWVVHRRFGVGRGTAVTTGLVFGLAPPLAVYSTQVYPEVVAALCVILAVSAITATPRRLWQGVVAVVALPWLAVKYAPVAAVLAVWMLVVASPEQRRRVVGVLLGAGAVFALFNQIVYGGATPYAAGDHFVGGEFTAVGTEVSLWGRASRLVGLLVDRGFGLAAWQPAYLLFPLALAWGWRRRPDLRWPIVILGVTWLTATFVALTMHGWWFPGRQLVVALPIVVLLVGVWADETRRRMGTVAVVGVVGIATFGFLVGAGLSGEITWVVDFANTTDPFRRLTTLTLPDYMTPDPSTWVLHGVWTVVIVATLVWGWWWAGAPEGGQRHREAHDQPVFVLSQRTKETI